jgi:hypothetical protein
MVTPHAFAVDAESTEISAPVSNWAKSSFEDG